MSNEQKQLIREKWKDINDEMLWTAKEENDEVADFWLNEIDLAIKQTEERIVREILDRIKNTIGINTNGISDDITLVKVFNDGGLCDFVDEKEYINKADLVRFITLIRNK